jgi:hypothetical protein
MPGLPSFEDGVVAALKLLGAGGSVLALLLTAFAIEGWIQRTRQVVAFAGVLAQGISQARESVARSPFRAVLALFVTVAVAIAQVFVLAWWYFLGNFVSLITGGDSERQRAARVAFGNSFLDFFAWDLDRIWDLLTLDGYSAVTLVIGGFFLVRTHSWAWGRHTYLGGPSESSRTIVGLMLALPGYLMFGWYVITALIVLFFTLLALVGILFGSAEWSDIPEMAESLQVDAPALLGTVFLAVYIGICVAASKGSKIARDSWR